MRIRQYRLLVITVFFWGIFLLSLVSVKEACAVSIIRDTEIEDAFKTWMAPIFKAADVNADDIKIILVGSDDVNAFVAGGRNIFIYTGLILKAESADEVMGVMAHEMGHIVGGHLVRMREEMEAASYQAMLAGVLGIAVGALGGQSDLGTAIYSGGANIAGRQYLKFSRAQESSADQAALRFFASAGYSPKGLLSFMETLEGQELLSSQYQNQYMRTHPVTHERVQAMQKGLEHAHPIHQDLPAQWQEEFIRIKAKLMAYMDPADALRAYGGQYDTVAGKYALAIVDYRQGRLSDALVKLKDLIKQEPNNPYFYELQGQTLLESQKAQEAVKSYEKALQLKPDADLIRIDLAQSYISLAGQKDKQNLIKARDALVQAKRQENKTPRLHRLLAIVYGRLGQEALAQLALAEEAVMSGNYKDARMFAERTKMALKENSGNSGSNDRGAWLKAQDIIQYVNNKKD